MSGPFMGGETVMATHGKDQICNDTSRCMYGIWTFMMAITQVGDYNLGNQMCEKWIMMRDPSCGCDN